MHKGSPVVQVPFLNFQAHAPEIIPDLKAEITEGETHRWKFYIYNISFLLSKGSAERWASWLTHFDLRAIIEDKFTDGNNIKVSLIDARLLNDSDYQDALIDAWMSWVQKGGPASSLSIERLRDSGKWAYGGCLIDDGPMCALILYHDALGVTPTGKTNATYSSFVSSRVHDMAMRHFVHRTDPDAEPKDPLQLSDDEFCNKYHSHHKKNLPCYRTKSLPEKR